MNYYYCCTDSIQQHFLICTVSVLNPHFVTLMYPVQTFTLNHRLILHHSKTLHPPACLPTVCPLSKFLSSLYLKDDSAPNHSGGDILLFIGHSFDLTELTVQLSVYVGEHGPHRATGYVEDILTADDQESKQHEAEQELCNQGPHRPALIPNKSTQHKHEHDDTLPQPPVTPACPRSTSLS